MRRSKHSSHKSSGILRPILFVIGLGLMIASPLLGILPGPGGIILFAIGTGLVLRNSPWAKRRYVQLKRKFPAQGRWVDWGMRRKSADRRNKVKNNVDEPIKRKDD